MRDKMLKNNKLDDYKILNIKLILLSSEDSESEKLEAINDLLNNIINPVE